MNAATVATTLKHAGFAVKTHYRNVYVRLAGRAIDKPEVTAVIDIPAEDLHRTLAGGFAIFCDS